VDLKPIAPLLSSPLPSSPPSRAVAHLPSVDPVVAGSYRFFLFRPRCPIGQWPSPPSYWPVGTGAGARLKPGLIRGLLFPQTRRPGALPQSCRSQKGGFSSIVPPLSISALGLLLISAGAHSPKPAKAVRKAKGKRKRKPRLGKAPKPSANVVPLRRRA
jgi:hypothetical protein